MALAWRGARAKRAPFCPVWRGGMVRSRLTPVLVACAFAMIGPLGVLLASSGTPAQAGPTSTSASTNATTSSSQAGTTSSQQGTTSSTIESTTTAQGTTTTAGGSNTTASTTSTTAGGSNTTASTSSTTAAGSGTTSSTVAVGDFSATSSSISPEVSGLAITAAPSTNAQILGNALPRTGSDSSRTMLLAVLALAVGSLLVIATRHRSA